MSARVEVSPVRGPLSGMTVIAVVVSLAIGALAGSLITSTVDDAGQPASIVARGAPAQTGWDAGKLEAMEGRQLAEVFRDTVVLSAAELNALRNGVLPVRLQGDKSSAVVLSAAELIALRNGEVAERLQGQPILWDAGKLEAMEGRQLAERFRDLQAPTTAKPSSTHPRNQMPKRG